METSSSVGRAQRGFLCALAMFFGLGSASTVWGEGQTDPYTRRGASGSTDTYGSPSPKAPLGRVSNPEKVKKRGPGGKPLSLEPLVVPSRAASEGRGRTQGLAACEACAKPDLECGGSTSGALTAESCTDADLRSVLGIGGGSLFVDYHPIELVEPQRVTIDLEGLFGLDTVLVLFDDTCTILAANDDCRGLSSCLTVDLDAGRYSIGCTTYDPMGVGEYDLSVTCQGVDAFCVECSRTDEAGEPIVVPENGSIRGTYSDDPNCASDRAVGMQIYHYTTQGGRCDFRLTAGFDTFLHLLDSNCNPIAGNDDCGFDLNSCIVGLVLPAGDYKLGVSAFAPGESGEFELSAACAAVAEDPCQDCNLGVVSCGVFGGDYAHDLSCSSDRGPGVQMYGFAHDGGPVIMTLTGDFDTYLTLSGAECGEIAANDDCPGLGLNSCLAIPDLDAGNYFVGVSAFDLVPSGTFSLEIRCPDVALCRDCSRGALPCDGEVQGSIREESCALEGGAARIDLYSVELGERTDISIEVASAAFDPRIMVFDAFCQPIGSFDCVDGTCLDLATFEPGSYSLGVVSPEGTPGDYTLRAECRVFSACESCLTESVSCGGTVEGEFTPDDCVGPAGPIPPGWIYDSVPFHVDEPTVVTARLTGPQPDSRFLVLRNAACVDMVLGSPCSPASFLAGLTTVGGRLYASDLNSARIFVHDADGALLEVLDAPAPLASLAGGDGRLFGTGADQQIYELSPTTGAVVRSAPGPLGDLPDADGLAWLDGSLYYFNAFGTGIIYELDPATLAVAAEHPLGAGAPTGFDGMAALGGLLYLSEYTLNQIHSFDPATNRFGASFEVSAPALDIVGGLGENPEAGLLYATGSINGVPQVFEIDPAQRSITGRFPAGAEADLSSCLSAEIPAGDYILLAMDTSGAGGSYTLTLGCEEAPSCTDCVVGAVTPGVERVADLPASECTRPEGQFLDLLECRLAGHTTISLSSPPDGGGFTDTVLFVFDSGCSVVASNDDCGDGRLDSCLEVDLAPGSYYVGVSSYDAGARGTYRLLVTTEDAPRSGFVRGNVDASDGINVTDPVRILGYLFLGVRPPECLDAADVDDNGRVDVSDAIRVLEYLFRAGPRPAEPFPSCGADPTPDELDCERPNCDV